MADPFVQHRERLKMAIEAAAARVQHGYVALVRQQLASVEGDDDVLLPGLLCLVTAEAFGAQADLAIRPASAVSLLGAMARVFEDIAAEGPAGLEREWGMPRTLNAVDAFYALAQAQVCDRDAGLEPEKQLAALGLLDDACHHLSLDLHSGSGNLRSLAAAGVAMGGLTSNADATQIAQLRLFAHRPAAVALQSLPGEVRTVLGNLLPYITPGARR